MTLGYQVGFRRNKKKQVDEAQSNSNNKINMMKKIMKDKNKNKS